MPSPGGKRPPPARPTNPCGPLLGTSPSAETVGTRDSRLSPPGLTPINPDRLQLCASPATDPSLLRSVTDMLVNGADIGYTGPARSADRPNNKSAASQSQAVTTAIQQEVRRGHTAGPFLSPPFQPFRCNPLGARPKPDGQVRLILDLSQPDGGSVNDFIDRSCYSLQYVTIDHAVAAIFEAGPHRVLMAKADLKHAFRLIPVRQDQWWLLGFRWHGLYYHDMTLPFGCRSACRLFNDLAEVLCQALSHHSSNPHVFHYLDDFFFFSPAASSLCASTYQTFLSICETCGVPLSREKCCPPTTRMELLGCVLDTECLTISLPEHKVQDIILCLQSVRQSRKVRQRELLSLIGKLIHATKCIPAGRSFFRRLLDTAHSVKRPHHWVVLTTETKRDLDWWLSLLPTWNGVAPMVHPTWSPPTELNLFTDASLVGYGGMCGTEWFAAPWPPATLRWRPGMSWLEMVPILVACALWGPAWQGRRITFHSDNSGVVGACKKGWSRDPRLMSLLRQTCFIAAVNTFTFRVQHVAGYANTTADALSRLQLDRFRLLQPSAKDLPEDIPARIRDFLANPTERCMAASGYAV